MMGWPCRPIGKTIALPPAQALSIGAFIDLDEDRDRQLSTSYKGPEDFFSRRAGAIQTFLHGHEAINPAPSAHTTACVREVTSNL